jgi:hypothetical protein
VIDGVGGSSSASADPPRALLLWETAAPRSERLEGGYCRGPGQQAGIWHGNLSARLAEVSGTPFLSLRFLFKNNGLPRQAWDKHKGNLTKKLAFTQCPPLLYGNGSFVIASIHARAPALSALVELVEPSVGAVVRDSVFEVVGYYDEVASSNEGGGVPRDNTVSGGMARDNLNLNRTYVNVSNVLHIGNCSGFTIKNNELRHVAEGAIAYGGQYGGRYAYTANCTIIDHFLHLNLNWSPRFSHAAA